MKAETQRSLIIVLLTLLLWYQLGFPTTKNDLTRTWFRVKGNKQERQKGSRDELERDHSPSENEKTALFAFVSK